jgi:hypothetical protein
VLDPYDVQALLIAWQTCYGDDWYDPRADFDRDGVLYMNDLNILVSYWPQQPNPPYPTVPDDCEPGGVWPPVGPFPPWCGP